MSVRRRPPNHQYDFITASARTGIFINRLVRFRRSHKHQFKNALSKSKETCRPIQCGGLGSRYSVCHHHFITHNANSFSKHPIGLLLTRIISLIPHFVLILNAFMYYETMLDAVNARKRPCVWLKILLIIRMEAERFFFLLAALSQESHLTFCADVMDFAVTRKA